MYSDLTVVQQIMVSSQAAGVPLYIAVHTQRKKSPLADETLTFLISRRFLGGGIKSVFWSKLRKKTVFSLFTPPPRVVEGWNLHVWQWIFELHSIVACKPAQLLQNRHFVEKTFGVLTKNFSDKNFCRQKCLWVSKNEMSGITWNAFWQSFAPIGAMFGG